tara:strand:+ start:459 stop:917 length:459 start_codon:yes stop_codon:yes gene_type:complete
MSEDFLKVQPIRNGTVIDHIEAGRGKQVLAILQLENSGTTISLLINVQSKKQKRKDIIKIEDRELDENKIEKLALISPNARVNIIRNYSVADKKEIDIPDLIKNIVKCPNENCISNNERGAISKFNLLDKEIMLVQCTYCGRKVKRGNFIFL